MRRFLLAAGSLALLTTSLWTTEAATRKVSVPNRYDGAWSIEVITQDGPCDRAYRYGVRIAKGEASYPGGDFDIRGASPATAPCGATIMRGSDGATVVASWIAAATAAAHGRATARSAAPAAGTPRSGADPAPVIGRAQSAHEISHRRFRGAPCPVPVQVFDEYLGRIDFDRPRGMCAMKARLLGALLTLVATAGAANAAPRTPGHAHAAMAPLERAARIASPRR